MKPWLSIIVPVYQVEAYLKDTLESLVNQSFKNIEIIVVNDGSPDRSSEIMETYHHQYPEKVKVIHKMNGGLGDARNAGILESTGEYITFVDGDDQLFLTACEQAYHYIQKKPCDILTLQMFWNTSKGQVQPVRYQEKWFRYGEKNLKNTLYFPIGYPVATCKLYKRELLIENNIYFEKRITGEDILFSLRTQHYSQNILIAPIPFYLRTERNETENLSITQQKSLKTIQDRLKVITLGVQYCEELGEKSWIPVFIRNQGRYLAKLMKGLSKEDQIEAKTLLSQNRYLTLQNRIYIQGCSVIYGLTSNKKLVQ